MQAVAVIVELVAFAAVTVLVIAMLQEASKPAPVGKAGGSHCAAAGAEAAEATGAMAMPSNATEARASPAAAAADERASEDPGSDEAGLRVRRSLRLRGRLICSSPC